MKRLLIICITGFLIFDTYHDGKIYSKNSWCTKIF